MIYIPVWIDLKQEADNFNVIRRLNLHSSMDRFEVKSKSLTVSEELIYIPVWIDLKDSVQ